MKDKIVQVFYNLRRTLAKYVVPEIFWPRFVIVENVKIKLRGTPYFFGVKLGLKKGEYEAPERRLLKLCNLQDATVIEMGGSIGIITAILSNMVGKNGRVISIEASKSLSDYSRIWIEKYSNAQIVTVFAFPVNQLKLSIDIIKFDETGMTTAGTVSYNAAKNNIKNKDNIYDINRISTLYYLKPSVLVVDIEGSEKILIDQNPEFPSSIKTILIELHPNIYGETIKLEILNKIKDEGFMIQANQENVFLFERN